MNRLPRADYSAHPDYQFSDITLAERIDALSRIAPHLGEARELLGEPLLPDYANLDCGSAQVASFVADGVAGFDFPGRQALSESARPLMEEWEARKFDRDPRQRTFEDCVRVCRAEEQPQLSGEILKCFEGEPARMLDALYGGAWEIELFLIHINDESDPWVWSYGNSRLYETPTLFYHVDTTVSRLKAMLYLSDDVEEENGAFSYVVGSHHWNVDREEMIVRRAIRNSGLYLRDERSRRAFAALPSWLQLKNDVGTELDPEGADARRLLEASRLFPSSTAGLVLFDPNGVHRGGVVRKGRRRAIQVVFQKR